MRPKTGSASMELIPGPPVLQAESRPASPEGYTMSDGARAESRSSATTLITSSGLPRLMGAVAFLLALSVASGLGAIGRSFSLACTTPCMKALGYQGCLDWYPTLNCVYVVFAVPLAATATSAFTVELGRMRSRGWLLVTCAAATTAAVLSMVLLMKPWDAWDLTDYKDENGNGVLANDCLQVFLGGGVFMTALPLAAAAAGAATQTDASQRYSNGGKAASIESVTDGYRRPKRMALMLTVLWAICVLLCSSLSPVWNFSFHSYSPFKSPYSILPPTEFGEHKFVFKLYEDTVVYYGKMTVFTLLGAISSGESLRQRVRLPGVRILRTYHPYPEGATVGELLVVFAIFLMYMWWLYYWRWSYDRSYKEGYEAHHLDNDWVNQTNHGGKCCIEFQVPPPDNGSSWEAGNAGSCHSIPDTSGFGETASLHMWGRVLGHLTSLSCSLLLLPATKNSAWFVILGVPFERALKYHRGLGLLTYIFVTLHMLLWWIKWAKEGTFLHNLLRPDDLAISPTWHHSDNFTIVIAEISWLSLTFMMGITLFARRKSYELFYYVHVPVGITFLIVALLHAWTFWYYAVGGLFLWTIDASLRTIRLSRAGQGVPSDARFDRSNGVTTLTFERGAFEHYAPAQYVFIYVPTIGLAERHPFTISSPPSAAQRTLHIKSLKSKNVGTTTFTDKLAQLVLDGGASQLGDVRIDGPYGSAGDLTATADLVLVAGGIGITPIISVYGELLALAKVLDSQLTSTALRRVRLIWSSRELSELALFAATLHEAAQHTDESMTTADTGTVRFESHLFLTSGSGKESEAQEELPGTVSEAATAWLRANVKGGRPNLPELCSDLHNSDSSTIFVCGPDPLTKAASELAYSCGAHFHTEVFHF